MIDIVLDKLASEPSLFEVALFALGFMLGILFRRLTSIPTDIADGPEPPPGEPLYDHTRLHAVDHVQLPRQRYQWRGDILEPKK